MPLSGKEIDSLIQKLKTNYRNYAEMYSAKWFNTAAFEQRLEQALKQKLNIDAFLLAEVSALEKLKEQFEEKKNASQKVTSIDKVAQENYNKLSGYPEMEIHHRANHELQKFLWVMDRCWRIYLPSILFILDGFDERELFYRIEREIAMLAKPHGNEPPPRIEDHIALLDTPGIREIEIDKNRNRYLMDGAMALNEMIDIIDKLIAFRHSSWDEPIKIDRIYGADEDMMDIQNLFQGKTGYGIFVATKDFAQQVIDDFRLQTFKRQR